jgi:hypothetical protein
MNFFEQYFQNASLPDRSSNNWLEEQTDNLDPNVFLKMMDTKTLKQHHPLDDSWSRKPFTVAPMPMLIRGSKREVPIIPRTNPRNYRRNDDTYEDIEPELKARIAQAYANGLRPQLDEIFKKIPLNVLSQPVPSDLPGEFSILTPYLSKAHKKTLQYMIDSLKQGPVRGNL